MTGGVDALGSRWSQEAEITAQAFKAGPADGALSEYFLKTFFCQFFPVGGAEIKDRGQRRERFFRGCFGKTVPGANILTGIAAKHPILEFVLHFPGDELILQFNGKIRNTFTAVHHFIVQDGFGGTGVDAAAASATIIAGEGVIIVQWQVDDQGGDKEERTGVAVQEVTVLTHPTEAAAYGPTSFEDRGAVYKSPAFYVADLLTDCGQQGI